MLFLWFFNILALPACVDNFVPEHVLISALNDSKQVYFPMITHIDIYLVLGIIKYWDKRDRFFLDFRRLETRALFFASIVTSGVNCWEHIQTQQ